MSYRNVSRGRSSRRYGKWAAVCAGLGLSMTMALQGVAAASGPPAPVRPQGRILDTPAALTGGLLHPDAPPAGADDWSCRPTRKHPRPVVLLHGSAANAYINWSMLSPWLKRQGYCVFAPNYGGAPGSPFKATGPIADSARQIAAYVDRVRKATGARQVDLVGHSQGGGPAPRWYLRFEGGTNPAHPERNKVRSLIALAPSNHGGNISGIGTLTTKLGLNPTVSAAVGQAWSDQMVGSEMNKKLDRDGDTQPGVHYTVIATRYDEFATPYPNNFLTAGPGATVRNILIQEICPQDVSDHLSLAYDTNAAQLVSNALDPAHAQPVRCGLSLPLLGG
ncbi:MULTISPECIES: alpha/beta fold hydrolase [unclassified Streptomyces]|uniref:esterase/lipase family protein n=1 Tax=unclassified Streptomyces TaxID=2593676 RepID=UPI002366B60F|nr:MULTISPECIES: alpha/beta fold hydrolase [unclassified Streptomyces]MDF3142276.1 alpha/beta fold hydrolase [Streptomyces sp. T21Q-yed]WDF37855.1 alpha/beta fold hydrolase [Streptomyces sp. T12]